MDYKRVDAVKSHKDLTVATRRNSSNICHAPQESSQVCWYYILWKSGSKLACNRKWWQETKVDWVTCMPVYVFRDNENANDSVR